MLDAAQQAADFKRALDNIKSRNIQAVAARMCRVLREFPSTFTERTTTVVNEGTLVELDLSGTLYDSVWEENIGSKLVKNMALTPSLAIDSIEALYKFNQILIEHGNEILSGASVGSFSSEFTTVYNRVYRMLISADYSASPKLTYSQKGFTLNPKKFKDIEEFPDTIGVYELGKYISRTDVITQFRIMHGYISSKVWQESTKASVSTARSYADRIETAVLCVIDTILDIAHAVDGIATCVDKTYGEKEVPIEEFDPALDGRYIYEIGIQPTSWIGAFSIGSAGTYQISIVSEYPYILWHLLVGGVENYPVVTSSVEGTSGRAVYLTEDIVINGKTNVTYQIRPLEGHGASFDSSKFKIYVRIVGASGDALIDLMPDTPSTTFEDKPVAWTGNKFYPPTYGKYKFILTYKSYTIKNIQYKGSNVSYNTATVDSNKVSDTALIDVTDISYPIVVNFNQSGTFNPNNIVSHEFYTIPAEYWEGNEYTVPVTTEDQIIYVKTKNNYTVDSIKSNGVKVTKYKLSSNIWMAKLTSRSNTVTIDYGPGIAYGIFDKSNVVYVKFTNVPITTSIANSLKPSAGSNPTDVTDKALYGQKIYKSANGVTDDTWYRIGAMAIFPVIGPPGEPIATFSASFTCFHEDIDNTFGDTEGTETTPINMKEYSSTSKKNGVYYTTDTYTSCETSVLDGASVENLEWVQITVSKTGSLSTSDAIYIAKLLGAKVYVTHIHTCFNPIGSLPYVHRWNMTTTAADDKFTASTTTKSVPVEGTWQVDNNNQSDWNGTTIKSAQYKVKWGLKENIIYSTYKYPEKFHFRIKTKIGNKITRIELRIKGTEFCKSLDNSYASYVRLTNTSVDNGYYNYEFDLESMSANNGLVDFEKTPFVVAFYGTMTAAELNNASNGAEWWFDGTDPVDPTKREYKWLTTMLRRTTKLKTGYGPYDVWDSNGYGGLKLIHSPLIGSDGFRSPIADEHWKYRYNKKWSKIQTEISTTAKLSFHTNKGISTYLSDYETNDLWVSRELSPIAASVGEVLNVVAHSGNIGSYDPEGNPGFTFNDEPVFNWIRELEISIPSWRRQTTGNPPQKSRPTTAEKEEWNLKHIFRVPKPGLYLIVNTQYKENTAATLPAGKFLYTSTATKAEMDAKTTFSTKKALFTAWPNMVANDWLYFDSDNQKTAYLLDLRYDSARDAKPITYFLFDTSASADYYRHIAFIRLTGNIV